MWDVCTTAALGLPFERAQAVTHDRWFARSFDRYVVFGADGTVREVREAPDAEPAAVV